MKLSEAIEIFTKFDNGQYSCDATTFRKALRLGKEALKAIIKYRPYDDTFSFHNLPGEDPQ